MRPLLRKGKRGGHSQTAGLRTEPHFSPLPVLFRFYGLWSEGPQMTVIFKHLTGWGDTPSPSSFGDEPRAGVRRRLNRKRLKDIDSNPSPLPSRISGGRAFTPGGAEEATAQRQGKKKRERDLGDGQTGCFCGRAWGLGWGGPGGGGEMIGSSRGHPPPAPSRPLTLHSPRAFPSLRAPLHPPWGREQLRQGGDHPLPVLFLGTPKSSDP